MSPAAAFEIDDYRLGPAFTDAVESALRRQLHGIRLDTNTLGTLFEVRDDRAPDGRVHARHVWTSPSGVTIGPATRLEIRPTTRAVIAAPHNGYRVHTPGMRRTGAAVVEIPADIRAYLSWTSVESPHDDHEYLQALDRFDNLVGIPKEEVLADIAVRMQGRDWLLSWSHRHYGTLISGAANAGRATPIILLAGDPGTGKSVLLQNAATILARRLDSALLFVQLNERLRGQGIQGRAGSDVVTVLDTIGGVAVSTGMPTLVFLDEAEGVAGSRAGQDGSSGAHENVAIVNALIDSLDRLSSRADLRLVFAMATNLVDRVDPAVLRRATVHYLDRPSPDDRRTILSRAFGEALDGPSIDRVNAALERTDLPLTAADVQGQVIDRSIREAAHRDQLIDLTRLLALAEGAIATQPVQRR